MTAAGRRIINAIIVAALTGTLCALYNPDIAGKLVDMRWSFNAIRDVLAGLDPYRHEPSVNMIPYPLTAAVLVLPWALIPGSIGLALLFGAACGVLAYGVQRDGETWRLMMFLTPCTLLASQYAQWSPLVMAALYYPAMSLYFPAKPTLAIPVALSIRWKWQYIAAMAGVVVLSLLLKPDWPFVWVAQTRSYGGVIPALTFIAPLALIAALFWWRTGSPTARFFTLMCLTPQHRYFYDQLLLWYLPRTPRQGLMLLIPSWAMLFYLLRTFDGIGVDAAYMLVSSYIPAFAVVCWQQYSNRKQRAATARTAQHATDSNATEMS